MPSLAGLRVLHPGLPAANLRPGRVEPAHALAHILHPRQVRRSLSLAADSAAVQAYLRGEALPSAGEAGWTLVCVDEFPLGWGKRAGGALKNRYPRGLRWPLR